MVAFDLTEPLAATFVSLAQGQGLLVNNTGPNTIRMVPPLTLTEGHVGEAAAISIRPKCPMKADAKQSRHRLLRRLVAGGHMHTQEELVEALRLEGVTVTQATVSRDIVELGLVRAAVGGRVIYTLPESVSART